MNPRFLRWSAASCLGALVLLCLGWELWLAPLRPGGSWLALKTLPLLWIAPGIVRGNPYTYRASTMMILAYFVEGTVRAWTEPALSGLLAIAEIALAVFFFAAAVGYVRAGRAVKSAEPTATG